MVKNLVIVESPAKARTISKFLGRDYKVEASIGHIRDLPSNAQEVPEKYKKEKWSRLGVDVENGYKPLYVIPETKKKQVKKLISDLKGVETLYLATDEDREGESISWHLLEILKPKVPVKRLVFHEITKDAIDKAIKNPRDIDQDLVHAQETRRILDRLYGYEVSPVLWRKIAPKLSAGRVQSVAIRMVVDRERARMLFVAADYFDLLAKFRTGNGSEMEAELKSVEGKKLVTGKDFDPETGKVKGKSKILLDEKQAKELIESIAKNEFVVEKIEKKPFTRNPEAPFTTSTLQQEAARKLRYSAKRTMQIAQKLYEHGFITYMRTDSTNLAESAVTEARKLATNLYGADYISDQPRVFSSKVKNAQEAHEAIRPAGNTFRLPEDLVRSGKLTSEESNLYELIWKRTIASQMKEAKLLSTIVEIGDGKVVFGASGKQIEFPGFLKAYVQGADDPDEELEHQEKFLPELKEKEKMEMLNVEQKAHQTKPVARYTEASLIKELEKRGIGRPSTYAAIMDTIIRRDYVFKQGTALVPTFVAFAVVRLMEQHFAHLVDYEFTAEMEEDLDKIADGTKQSLPYLDAFYKGAKGHEGLIKLITQEIDPKQICTLQLPALSDLSDVEVHIGRFGPYVQRGESRSSLPDDMSPAELDKEKVEQLLKDASKEQEGVVLGKDKTSGENIYKKVGRYGPYLQLGDKGEDAKKKVKIKSIPKFFDVDNLSLENAEEILSWPKSLGKLDDKDILFDVGPYGPYLKYNGKNKAIPASYEPLKLSLKEAKEILEGNGKTKDGKDNKGANDVDLGNGIVGKVGRYGPYITNGKINVSVPKGKTLADLTKEEAKELIDKKT